MWTRALCLFLLAGWAVAQTPAAPTAPAAAAAVQATTNTVPPAPSRAASTLIIPAGTRVPLSLKQAISTKTAKEGDAVYAETTFPFVIEDRIVIPPGTYVQGRIRHVQRGGHIKGRAEILVHFTSMIYPSGYTVILGGAVENTPGAGRTSVTDSEGTIRQDSDTGKKAATAASTAGAGAAIGGIHGWKGAGVGAGIGGAAGLAIAMLSRGSDVKLEPGTSIEMEIERDIPVNNSRISARPAVRVEQ
ncbi:MAG: hypothetical protein ACHP7J_01035 [Terriglobales bacterium]